MTLKIAVVQPRSYFGDEEYKNVAQALGYIEEAVKQGAQLVFFPEGYPGRYSGPMDSGGMLAEPPIETIRAKAKKEGVYICAGDLEENPAIEGTYYLTQQLISPQGEVLLKYRRTHPDHPILNAYLMGGRKHILPGNEFGFVETELGKIGILICSELYVPEIARTLTLMGAQLLLVPTGGLHTPTRTNLQETWYHLARARAAENLLYVAMTQNLFQGGYKKGRAGLVSPEREIFWSGEAGVFVGEVDLEYIRSIRERFYDEELLSPPASPEEVYLTRPGQIYERRPYMYQKLLEPQPGAFDYLYYEKDLESFDRKPKL